MDRLEIVAKRGYETFAEHYMNAGIKKGKEEGIIEGEEKDEIKGHMGLRSNQQIAEAKARLEILQKEQK